MKKRHLIIAVALLLPVGVTAGSPVLVQEHVRWRNDDGSETAATWKANADTVITGQARSENVRLRFCIANTDASYSGTLSARLEYAENTGGPWTAVGTDGSTAFMMTPTAGYANGEATTAQLAGSGTFGSTINASSAVCRSPVTAASTTRSMIYNWYSISAAIAGGSGPIPNP